jgi:hypothetical protein
MKADLDTLQLFNEKVTRLEASGLMRRFAEAPPEVVATFERLDVVTASDGSVEITGTMTSSLTDLNQDEIDAFVLTYRLFTQANDRISIRSMSKIYSSSWMPAEAGACFEEARTGVNRYLSESTSILIGHEPLSVERMLRVVVYGGLAHTSVEEEAVYRSWMADGGIAGFVWAEFVVALKRMLHFLLYFRSLNAAVITNLAV